MEGSRIKRGKKTNEGQEGGGPAGEGEAPEPEPEKVGTNENDRRNSRKKFFNILYTHNGLIKTQTNETFITLLPTNNVLKNISYAEV